MLLTEESLYLSFSGIRVHFRVVRPDTPIRNRILLLASPMICAFHWRKLLPELSELGSLAVLVDLPGFGHSDPNAPQDVNTRASMIWGVLDEVDRSMGAPLSLWHLAGHGSACGTLLCMGAQYPDSVKSQIHIAPVFSVEKAFRKPENRERFYADNILRPGSFRRLIESWAGFPMDDYIVDRMRAPLMRPGMRRTFDHMLGCAVAPPREGLGFCPAMALLGGRDPLLDESRLLQTQSLLSGAETHRLSSAGHFPMETHSKALRDYLRGWLRYND
jgi:pimeloyl-ACP methyl ester carboxylesterase